MVFSPDGATLASGSGDRTIRLWDPTTGRSTGVLVAHAGGVAALAYSPDGTVLAGGGHDNTVRLWNPRSGQLIRALGGRGGAVLSVAFSPDGRQLVAAGEGADLFGMRKMRLWLLGD